MASLGDMVVRIVGDTTGFEKSITDTQKKMVAFGVNAAAVVAAVVQVGKAIQRGVKDFVDYGSAINDAAEKTGLSRDAIQEWKYIAEQTGTTLESVTGAVGLMTRGLTTNAKEFKALGIEVKNSDGSFRSTTDIFNDTIATLSSMTDETARDQLAFKLLGRSAQSLIPILNAGTSGIDEMRKKAHELGIVLSEENIKNADELGDSLDTLKSSMQNMGRAILAELAPPLISLASGLTNIITQSKKAQEAFGDFQTYLKGGAAVGISDLALLQNALIGVNKQITQITGDTRIPTSVMQALQDERKELLGLIKEAELAQKNAAIAARTAADKAKKDAEDAAARMAAIEAERIAYEKMLADRQYAFQAYYATRADIEAQSAADTANAVSLQEHLGQVQASTNEAEIADLTKIDEYTKMLTDSVSTGLVGAFETFGEALVSGDNPMKAFFKSLIGAVGDSILAFAALVEAQGWASIPINLLKIAEGIALAVSGGVVKASANYLADGGIVQPQPGGVQAVVAEAGMAEAVIPLDKLDRMLQNGGGGSSGGMQHITVNLDSKPILDTIFPATRDKRVLISAGAVV